MLTLQRLFTRWQYYMFVDVTQEVIFSYTLPYIGGSKTFSFMANVCKCYVTALFMSIHHYYKLS